MWEASVGEFIFTKNPNLKKKHSFFFFFFFWFFFFWRGGIGDAAKGWLDSDFFKIKMQI